jgi:hypothetical protein
MAGQSVTITTSIVVDKDGFWTTMSTNAPTGVATSVREGVTARRTLKEKTETFEVKPGARVFDNYGPALMSQPVRLYDRAKGGKQSFPLVVLPGAAVDASLEFKDKVERTVAGKDLTLYRYTYGLPGVDVSSGRTPMAASSSGTSRRSMPLMSAMVTKRCARNQWPTRCSHSRSTS